MRAAMKTFLTLTTALFVISLSPVTGFGQTNFAGGVHFSLGIPQGELDDQIDQNAYGLGGQIFYSPQRSPLALGLDVAWMNYGTETRQEPFSSTIPDVTVEVETSNNILQGFLVLRGQMPGGPIRLYADGLVGFNYLFTQTSISDVGDFSEDIATSTNLDDATFAYGVGGGLMVPVFTRTAESGEGRPLQVLIDGGVRYISGGEAEYLKKGSIRREGGDVTFDSIESETNMLTIQLGAVIRF